MKSLFAAVPRPRCRIAVGFCKDAGRDWSSWDKTCLALVPSALRQGRTRALWPFGGESLFRGRREGGGKGRRRGLRMGTSLLLVPTQTPDVILAVVLPSTTHLSLQDSRFSGGCLFQSGLENLALVPACDLSQIWGRCVNSRLSVP